MTEDLYVGRFASRERLDALRALGITDVLNVSDTPNLLTCIDGPFRTVTWINIEDRTRIPTANALDALNTIHAQLSSDAGRVYVHCMAGWNRSPTILWLYLVACGTAPDAAAKYITANAFDAVPGHALLVDSTLIDAVLSHGRMHFQPHPRKSAITQ
ncbi:MAG: dual specificity protein phosphatase [Pirellulaceae bacterium]|nr:dual specificity protein phosphatase [Pirellulaceae bacterium]